MNIETEPYVHQTATWPSEGRVILAQYDDESVVVYQAYCPETGNFAAQHGYFGGGFKLSRMSWIKPNFLWMMYRSGWAAKQGHEVVLAVRIKRFAFDEILRQAVYSSFNSSVYESREAWKTAVASSSVRLQWDPDHSPDGGKLERRAIQLGLSGDVLERYSREWIVDITDISGFIRKQREYSTPPPYDQLVIPRERAYPVSDELTIRNLQLQNTG